MNDKTLYEETVQTSVKSTAFTNGMVVNASDLQRAMLYPLELIQVLIRAYFDCGIVCGLELATPEESEKCQVTISSGVALDCDGYPLQLCKTVTVPLTPDPCEEEDTPRCVCIAISRSTSPSAPRECGSDDNGGSQAQYARQTEAVKIKAFPVAVSDKGFDCAGKCEELPDNLCGHEPEEQAATTPGEGPQDNFNYCDCLKHCPEPCCGESWVLIGCVQISDTGILTTTDDCRKYVKPIDCACQHEAQPTHPTVTDQTR